MNVQWQKRAERWAGKNRATKRLLSLQMCVTFSLGNKWFCRRENNIVMVMFCGFFLSHKFIWKLEKLNGFTPNTQMCYCLVRSFEHWFDSFSISYMCSLFKIATIIIASTTTIIDILIPESRYAPRSLLFSSVLLLFCFVVSSACLFGSDFNNKTACFM